ncbi:hypothetical protein LJR130_006023 [Variovorax sp. LjRoot130]
MLDSLVTCPTAATAPTPSGVIEQKIAVLAAMRQLLGGLVQQCDAVDGGTVCLIIDVLARE